MHKETKIILSNESSQFNKQLALLGQYEYEDEDNDSIKTDIENGGWPEGNKKEYTELELQYI